VQKRETKVVSETRSVESKPKKDLIEKTKKKPGKRKRGKEGKRKKLVRNTGKTVTIGDLVLPNVKKTV